MPDLERVFTDIENDVSNIVQGDVEIGGKRIPKIALVGAGIGGVALLVILKKKSGGLSLGSGSSSPAGNSTIGQGDNGGLGVNNNQTGDIPLSGINDAIDAVKGNLSGITDGQQVTTPSFISNGDLGSVVGTLPDLSAFTNPAFSYLPDLSSFGLTAPQPIASDYGQGAINAPYSQIPVRPPTNPVQAVTKPVSNSLKNMIAGLRSAPVIKSGTKPNVSGNAIVKNNPSGIINLFSGVGTKPFLKPNTGNAISSKPVLPVINLFGGNTPKPVPINPITNFLNLGVKSAPVIRPNTQPNISGNAVRTTPIFNIFGNSTPKPVTSVQPNRGAVGFTRSVIAF